MNNTQNAVTGEGSALRNSFKVGLVYLLVRDVVNPKPDRRVKDDWRAQPNWVAGMRFQINSTHITGDIYVPSIVKVGRWTHQRMLLRNTPRELLAALVETKPTVDESLRAADVHAFKSEAIDLLVQNGTITLEQLINAAHAAAAEFDKENA